MVQHVFSLLSAPAFLGGIVCLSVALSRIFPMPCTPAAAALTCPAPSTQLNRLQLNRFRCAGGFGCALAGFLLLPTGSFPAYIPCAAAIPVWLILFATACATLGLATGQDRGRAWTALSTPLVAGLAFAVCARYAWLHGFPGNIWAMDVYVALPLYTGADAVHIAGFGCLATAMVLQGAALPQGTPAFSACVRLAAAQFTVCLLFPALPSRLWTLPALPALLADTALNGGLVLGVYLLFHLIQRGHGLNVLVLLMLGAGLCLGI